MNVELAEYNAFVAGSRMFALREELGLTQAEVAKLAHLSPMTISHYESGRRRPSIRNLLLICEALRCTPNDLLLEQKYTK